MAGDSEEPDNAAARLEVALERIAAAAARRDSAPPAPPAVTAPPDHNATAAVAPEMITRLDGLIERLRGALAVRPG